jgi:3D (Asp-Asp-Asp) domain-containing protein
MQAIITTYKPATNTRGSHILARCTRGSISAPYDHELDFGQTTSQPRKLSSTDSSRKTCSNAPNRPAATPSSMKLLLLTALALALTTPAHGPKLRRFTVTAYCHCRVCTHRGDGITASGVRVREGTTIAAPRSIPFGTRIHMPGAGWRTVQDRLSRRYDHRLDLYFTSHKRALQWGIQHLTCTIN